MTTFRWYMLGLLALFGLYVAFEYYKPKPLDWRPTYVNADKIPFGTFVLFDQLPRLLGTDSVTALRVPIFNQLTGLDEPADSADPSDAADTTATVAMPVAPDSGAAPTDTAPVLAQAADTAAVTTDDLAEESGDDSNDAEPELRPAQANYLFVNNSFAASPPDTRALLRFVAAGNDVFIAAEDFGGYRSTLRDSLGFRTEELPLSIRTGRDSTSVLDSLRLRFTNPALAGRRYLFAGDQARTRLLVQAGRRGQTLATDANGRAVLLRLAHGRGHFYLCSVPVAFTNYYVLRPGPLPFAAAALAYLPARPAWWDEYQKQGRVGDQSLLRLLFTHEALRWAYYLLCAAVGLFVLVEARRRQRVIPVLKPLPNTTLLFTRTVAGLYRQGSNHARIAEKKIDLFRHYLLTRFQESSPDFSDNDFRERLSQKTGLPRPRVDELLRLLNFARTAPQVNDHELLVLSRALSEFRRDAR